VLAGCNGAGKSRIGGAALRQVGGDFFNPDEAAQRIAAANATRNPPLTQTQINAAAGTRVGGCCVVRSTSTRLSL
jgi:predicted ABC-type ATPase